MDNLLKQAKQFLSIVETSTLKDEEIKLEPRILIENPTLSNIEKDKDTEKIRNQASLK